MPFIIWGTKGVTSTLEEGEFYCPRCDADGSRYHLKGVQRWFTLYFIGLFPVGGTTKHVECDHCGGTFKEAVLDLKPPTPAERLAAGVGEALTQGLSLGEAEKQVVEAGIPKDQAGEFVAAVAGENRWTCPMCGEEYVKSVRKCRACAGSRS